MLNLVTILALIYVPITAITSVFGMNIKQINGTGHHISTFVLTAVVALMITWITWYVAEAMHDIRDLKAKRISNPDPAGTGFSLPLRLSFLVWLFGSGHGRWASNSGATRQILTNSNNFLDQRFNRYAQHDFTASQSPRTACDYVKRAIILHESREMFPPGGFDIDDSTITINELGLKNQALRANLSRFAAIEGLA